MNPAAKAAYDQRWDDALAILRATNDPQLEILAGRHPRDLLTPPGAKALTRAARVGACKGFMPEGFAPWFIAKAAPALTPALVNNASGRGVPDPSRTATMFQIGPDQRDVLTAIMQERAARLTTLPVAAHEPPNVLSYEVGQHYAPHFDFVDPAQPIFADELRTFGQRVMTIVTYLNDDFDDAPTIFPHLGIQFRGGVGDAVVFANVLPNGEPDRSTLHAGTPPTRGRKWVLSQWMRSRTFMTAQERPSR